MAKGNKLTQKRTVYVDQDSCEIVKVRTRIVGKKVIFETIFKAKVIPMWSCKVEG